MPPILTNLGKNGGELELLWGGNREERKMEDELLGWTKQLYIGKTLVLVGNTNQD